MTLTADRWSQVMATNTGTKLQWGPNSVDRYLLDPKRIGFMFARYKFAAKMLRDCTGIVDVGCGDGMGTVTFLEDTNAGVHGIDLDPALIKHAQALRRAASSARGGLTYERLAFDQYDVLSEAGWDALTMQGGWDGLCCLDVIEHIDPSQSSEFVRRLAYLTFNVAVIGTPSDYASQFASPQSQLGHINLYTPDRLREELGRHFRHTFLFSMNDEIVHTGFDKLAHYLIALCIK